MRCRLAEHALPRRATAMSGCTCSSRHQPAAAVGGLPPRGRRVGGSRRRVFAIQGNFHHPAALRSAALLAAAGAPPAAHHHARAHLQQPGERAALCPAQPGRLCRRRHAAARLRMASRPADNPEQIRDAMLGLPLSIRRSTNRLRRCIRWDEFLARADPPLRRFKVDVDLGNLGCPVPGAGVDARARVRSASGGKSGSFPSITAGATTPRACIRPWRAKAGIL